jgi:hypothetical protein
VDGAGKSPPQHLSSLCKALAHEREQLSDVDVVVEWFTPSDDVDEG